MKLTEEQRESLEVAAKPLMAWLLANCHPHTLVIVENDRAELLEGLAMVRSGSLPSRGNESLEITAIDDFGLRAEPIVYRINVEEV